MRLPQLNVDGLSLTTIDDYNNLNTATLSSTYGG